MMNPVARYMHDAVFHAFVHTLRAAMGQCGYTFADLLAAVTVLGAQRRDSLGQYGAHGRGWIGVDLDGTLAEDDGWHGEHHIGPPIPVMVDRVRRWLEDGHDVRIFTARATSPSAIPYVEAWAEEHLGRRVPVTNVKDWDLHVLIDDRAVQAISNTGQIVSVGGGWLHE